MERIGFWIQLTMNQYRILNLMFGWINSPRLNFVNSTIGDDVLDDLDSSNDIYSNDVFLGYSLIAWSGNGQSMLVEKEMM